MSKVVELYGNSTISKVNWDEIVSTQHCPFINRKCIKVRKSEAENTIGTCTVLYGKQPQPIMICPHRLLERRQIFIDCLHLLTLHEPGNELHIVSEVSIPGGSVDYFLVSRKSKKIVDFVGIELQTLDTTGTVWTERQRFLKEHGIKVKSKDSNSDKSFGMNWKMSAKTILVQLHHKVQTFESINKRLVLIIQNNFMDYMKKEFRFDHLNNSRLGDSMQLHTYQLSQTQDGNYEIQLSNRYSTDSNGIAESLGLQASPKVELEQIIQVIETKISKETLFTPL